MDYKDKKHSRYKSRNVDINIDDEIQRLANIIQDREQTTGALEIIDMVQQYVDSDELNQLLTRVSESTDAHVVERLLIMVLDFSPNIPDATKQIVLQKCELLLRYPEFYRIIEDMEPREIVPIFEKYYAQASAFAQTRKQFFTLYSKKASLGEEQSMVLDVAIATDNVDKIVLPSIEKYHLQFSKNTQQVRGDLEADLAQAECYKRVELHENECVHSLIEKMFNDADGRQKKLLEIASNLVYDTVQLKFDQDQRAIQSIHGSNLLNEVTPFPLVVDPNYVWALQQFDPLQVVSTLLQFVEHEDFVVSASDYETILFLMFSKMGYFCNEVEPEDEDWGKTVVKDTD